jgi:CRISPR-associated endonuclease Cas3-HD
MRTPCSFSGETLTQHSLSTVEFGAKKFFETQPAYPLLAAEKLTNYYRLEKPITEERLTQTCIAACYLHDAGKAANLYQVKFNDDCSCKENPTFTHHEILSGFIVYNYLEKAMGEEDQSNRTLRMLTTLAVLNHMHAIRPYTNAHAVMSNVVYTLKKYIYKYGTRGDPLGFSLANYNEYIDNAPPQIDKKILATRFEKPIKPDELSRFLEKMDRETSGPNKLYALLLAPIIIGDNLAASQRQGVEDNRKWFKQELKELINS